MLIPDYTGDPEALIGDIDKILKDYKYSSYKRKKGTDHHIMLEAVDTDAAEKMYELICKAKMDNVKPKWLCDRS